MRLPKLMVLAPALCVLALAKADLPPVYPPGMEAIASEPGVSKETGWVDVDWGSGGIGRACARGKQEAGSWVWCTVHNDRSVAMVFMRKNVAGPGWLVAASLIDADGNEWRTAANAWTPGNAKYPGWHVESGIGVDIWVDVGTAPPE